MRRSLEPLLWIGLVVLFAVLLFVEGRRAHALEAQIPLTPKELYQKLARSQVRLQLVDVRPELADNYEDAHIPGAIPFPGCDDAATPEAARAQRLSSAPTVIISADGDAALYQKCLARFTSARNLAGGMTAWDDASYPEDTGEYTPPKTSAGGGCL
ncbi:MAG: rhodanese-like domain-containing protein [Deltaproteobacteria bacterium]|nr:rhodanese-like domain-containing protein [Deltaproteobacteria bacterium]